MKNIVTIHRKFRIAKRVVHKFNKSTCGIKVLAKNKFHYMYIIIPKARKWMIASFFINKIVQTIPNFYICGAHKVEEDIGFQLI